MDPLRPRELLGGAGLNWVRRAGLSWGSQLAVAGSYN